MVLVNGPTLSLFQALRFWELGKLRPAKETT